jgi:hypothetical protein
MSCMYCVLIIINIRAPYFSNLDIDWFHLKVKFIQNTQLFTFLYRILRKLVENFSLNLFPLRSVKELLLLILFQSRKNTENGEKNFFPSGNGKVQLKTQSSLTGHHRKAQVCMYLCMYVCMYVWCTLLLGNLKIFFSGLAWDRCYHFLNIFAKKSAYGCVGSLAYLMKGQLWTVYAH